MIGYLTGEIISKKPTQVLLDVNGVGYLVNISLTTFEKLPAEKSKISLHTYLNVQENALTLYGFSVLSEKEMFELLISISGIGPKYKLTNLVKQLNLQTLPVLLQFRAWAKKLQNV